ncbi:MAG: GTPase Era [Bdellovibrionales bacterium]
MMTSLPTSCGFIAVIGLPNAGKSTLINALVGQKVSIVSKRAQTTRCRILGIALHDTPDTSAQMIFIDTPGVFEAKKMMERAMVGAAFDALEEADAILHVVDVSQKNTLARNEDIIKKIETLASAKRPVFLALNKIDCIAKEALLDFTAQFNARFDYAQTFMISALKENGLSALQDKIANALPAGPWHYEADEITDMPMRMMAAEITREKIFHQLHEELPYAALVETEEWEHFDNGDIRIGQCIYVQRDSQKAIVLGKGGSRIKKLGEAARKDLQDILQCRVHLKLFIRVREDWPEKAESLRIMGLDP